MTQSADLLRDKRRAFATPGGFHDGLIRFLGKLLPIAIGVAAAIMLLSPLAQRNEISFLLDRNKVDITRARVQVDQADYRGIDNDQQIFSISAKSAVQNNPAVPVVSMLDLVATLQMRDGPASLVAPTADYNFSSQNVASVGPVNFKAADGYTMVTHNVDIDLQTKVARGENGVSGTTPTGTFTAQSIKADFNERTVTLDGKARLLMQSGKLRMP